MLLINIRLIMEPRSLCKRMLFLLQQSHANSFYAYFEVSLNRHLSFLYSGPTSMWRMDIDPQLGPASSMVVKAFSGEVGTVGLKLPSLKARNVA